MFFELVRQRVSAEDLFFIRNGRTPNASGSTSAMSWSDRLAAAQEARAKSGEVSAVSMLIVGTPTRITPKDGFVLVTIEQEEIPPLPKGLPGTAERGYDLSGRCGAVPVANSRTVRKKWRAARYGSLSQLKIPWTP